MDDLKQYRGTALGTATPEQRRERLRELIEETADLARSAENFLGAFSGRKETASKRKAGTDFRRKRDLLFFLQSVKL